jgi:hypothetical protein
MKKQRNDGEKQKQVNQTCTYMENQETACPQQQKNKEDCYEHGRPPEAECLPLTITGWRGKAPYCAKLARSDDLLYSPVWTTVTRDGSKGFREEVL